MNPYQVDWTPEALDDLAGAWLHAADRSKVNAAQDQIDDLLGRDPIGNGSHLNEGLYRVVCPPLTAFYAVDQTRRSVEVSQVCYTP
jgi:hypothetical protein